MEPDPEKEAAQHRALVERTKEGGAAVRRALEWLPDGVSWETGTPFAFFPDGYAVPSTFKVRARSGDGQVRAEIDVVVEAKQGKEAKRAWPRRVEIASDLPGGVNSIAIRGLPIRHVMGFGVSAVHRVSVQEAGLVRMEQVEGLDPEATRLMASLVGYIDPGAITEGLTGEEER